MAMVADGRKALHRVPQKGGAWRVSGERTEHDGPATVGAEGEAVPGGGRRRTSDSTSTPTGLVKRRRQFGLAMALAPCR